MMHILAGGGVEVGADTDDSDAADRVWSLKFGVVVHRDVPSDGVFVGEQPGFLDVGRVEVGVGVGFGAESDPAHTAS